MSKKDKNIENLFRKKFENFESVPPEQIWTNIADKMIRPNLLKKIFSRFNILIFTSILTIVTIVKISYDYNRYTQKKNIATNSNSFISEQIPTMNTLENKETDEQKNNQQESNPTDYFKTVKKIKNNITALNKPEINIKKTEKKNETTPYPDFSVSNYTQNISAAAAKADFDADTESGCVPLKITFRNKSKLLDSCVWDFGNGNQSTEKNPICTFDKAGKYCVKLSGKYKGTDFTYVKIIEALPLPTVDFNIENFGNASADEAVKFDNLSENQTEQKWDFGDGQTSTQTSPEHIYKKKGIYDIILQINNDKGCSNIKKIYDLVVKDSKYVIKAPTAFTPNTGGENDGRFKTGDITNQVFYPIFTQDVKNLKMRIYDKNGKLLFESDKIGYGWNGYYNHKLSSVGVYVWECAGKYADGRDFYDYGNITLIYLQN
jgi:PKD repeat protein